MAWGMAYPFLYIQVDTHDRPLKLKIDGNSTRNIKGTGTTKGYGTQAYKGMDR
jgi:hypothetical protein